MAGTQLQVLRRRIVRSLGLFKSGTATGGALNYLTDTGLLSIYDDNYFVGSGIVIIDADAAPPEGEKRFIQVGDKINSKVSVTIPFTVAPQSGDTYEIYRGLDVEDVEDAINEAIRMAAPGFWEPVVDVTLVWVADQYIYSLGSFTKPVDPFYDIDRVYVRSVETPTTYPYDDLGDEVLFYWEGTTPKIQLFREFSVGDKIRVCYRVRPTEMSTPTSTTGVSYAGLDVYLRAAAVELLMATGFFGPESGDVEWRQERWGMQKADEIFERFRMKEPIGRVIKSGHHIPMVTTKRPDVALGG